MDEPIRAQVSEQSLKDEANAANRLLEDAQKGHPLAAERLQFTNNIAGQVANRFTELDTSDNNFLGKHELQAAAKSIPGAQVLLNNYDQITPLYYDHLNAYKTTISQDYLGISKGDLAGLKAVTSNNYGDLTSLARSNALDTLPGRAGFIVGGVTAGTSAIAGFVGLCAPRAGLVGLGVGLGIVGAGYLAGYYMEKGHLDNLRNKISNDNSLDGLILSARSK